MSPRAQKLQTYRRRPRARVASGTRVVEDSTRTFVPVLDWLGGTGADKVGNAEHRADELVRMNRGLLEDLHIRAEIGRVRGEPGLRLQTGTRVGAIPLRSPVTGRADFGLVVKPRFPWSGIGDLLSSTGFRIVPELLPLPELPQSERRIPPWVLSSVVLQRLERLLDATARRFTTVHADRSSPRGAIDWPTYATLRLARARALDVPCTFPDLRDDEELRAAVHWAVRRHRQALLGAAGGARVVRELLSLCERLLARVAGTPPRPPGSGLRASWHRRPFVPRAFTDGIQAIDWTADERGLAGLSDLAGLSWRLDMDVFFEAWVETIAAKAATRTGATLKTARQGQTRVALDWSPKRSGSQGSLLPDVVIRRPEVTVILDAKYKRHAEQIRRLGWSRVGDAIREQHRADLLQALAYSTMFDSGRVVSILVYPCDVAQWNEFRGGNRVLARASLRTSGRQVEVGLLAVPLGGDPVEPSALLEKVIRQSA